MKNLIIAVFAMIAITNVAYASDGYGYKGSHTGYDVAAETAVMKMIESQTDPETEKVQIDGKTLKFEYFENTFFPGKDGSVVGSVHFSDNNDQYVFDYHVVEERVVKIILYTENGKVINRQVYPERDEASSDSKK